MKKSKTIILAATLAASLACPSHAQDAATNDIIESIAKTRMENHYEMCAAKHDHHAAPVIERLKKINKNDKNYKVKQNDVDYIQGVQNERIKCLASFVNDSTTGYNLAALGQLENHKLTMGVIHVEAKETDAIDPEKLKVTTSTTQETRFENPATPPTKAVVKGKKVLLAGKPASGKVTTEFNILKFERVKE